MSHSALDGEQQRAQTGLREQTQEPCLGQAWQHLHSPQCQGDSTFGEKMIWRYLVPDRLPFRREGRRACLVTVQVGILS